MDRLQPRCEGCARTRASSAAPAPGDSLAAVFEAAVPRKLPARTHVYHEGDDRTQLFRVEAGQVTLYRTKADGRRHILAFAGRGSIIGLSADDSFADSAVANTTVTLRSASVEHLERCIAERRSSASRSSGSSAPAS